MLPVLNRGVIAPEVALAVFALNGIRIFRREPELRTTTTYDGPTCQAMTEWQRSCAVVRRTPIGSEAAKFRSDGVIDGRVWSALGVTEEVGHSVQRFGQTHPQGCWRACADMLNRSGVCRELPPTLTSQLYTAYSPFATGTPSVANIRPNGSLATTENALQEYARWLGGRLVRFPPNTHELISLMRARPVIALGTWGRVRGIPNEIIRAHAVVISAVHRVEWQTEWSVDTTFMVRVEDPAPVGSNGRSYCVKLIGDHLNCETVNFFPRVLVAF